MWCDTKLASRPLPAQKGPFPQAQGELAHPMLWARKTYPHVTTSPSSCQTIVVRKEEKVEAVYACTHYVVWSPELTKRGRLKLGEKRHQVTPTVKNQSAKRKSGAFEKREIFRIRQAET